jgi:cGMP-dependent protein kinase
MFYCQVQPGEFIFKQGDMASAYFIINLGSMEIIIHDQVRKVIKAGDGFGELAVLFNAERSASVRAVELCGLWGIDRRTFRKVVQEMMNKQYKENRKFMEKIKFFRKTTFLLLYGNFIHAKYFRSTHRTTKGFNCHGFHATKVQKK